MRWMVLGGKLWGWIFLCERERERRREERWGAWVLGVGVGGLGGENSSSFLFFCSGGVLS